jgi:hypothetical protein
MSDTELLRRSCGLGGGGERGWDREGVLLALFCRIHVLCLLHRFLARIDGIDCGECSFLNCLKDDSQ